METAEHASVADLAPDRVPRLSLGDAAVQSFGNLAASAVAGLLWTLASPTLAFGYAAALTGIALAARLQARRDLAASWPLAPPMPSDSGSFLPVTAHSATPTLRLSSRPALVSASYSDIDQSSERSQSSTGMSSTASNRAATRSMMCVGPPTSQYVLSMAARPATAR